MPLRKRYAIHDACDALIERIGPEHAVEVADFIDSLRHEQRLYVADHIRDLLAGLVEPRAEDST